MSEPIFIGDELSVAGYRLGGVRAVSPGEAEAADVFRRALEEHDPVLISVECARRVPAAELNRALAGGRPLVLVVPDVRGRTQMRNLAQRMRGELGMAAL